jgi:hypothetical protein
MSELFMKGLKWAHKWATGLSLGGLYAQWRHQEPQSDRGIEGATH